MLNQSNGIINVLRCHALSPENIDVYQDILHVFEKHQANGAARYLRKAIDHYKKDEKPQGSGKQGMKSDTPKKSFSR